MTPDEIRIIEFSRGILIGSNAKIICGGHACPISMFGEILLWKNPQKNETKKHTSDVINSTIPIFSPLFTRFRWLPCSKDSDLTSFHQVNEIIKESKNALKIRKLCLVFKHSSREENKERPPSAPINGQGLG